MTYGIVKYQGGENINIKQWKEPTRLTKYGKYGKKIKTLYEDTTTLAPSQVIHEEQSQDNGVTYLSSHISVNEDGVHGDRSG